MPESFEHSSMVEGHHEVAPITVAPTTVAGHRQSHVRSLMRAPGSGLTVER
jgi:hypothetical protein